MLNKEIHAPPKATAMLEALRGLGYSPASALADLIDNSISAGAGNISLQFCWLGEKSYIVILDDGKGMDRSELHRAMLLGDRSPLDARSADDLGRFGMGLKTASFSQCRRLTVASKKHGDLQCLRWDLDILAKSTVGDGWFLLVGPAEGSNAILDLMAECDHGTLVLWESLDRFLGGHFSEQSFLDLIDSVERHLCMVFHRYLAGLKPRVRLYINGRPLTPWDPFLASHPATWCSPIARLSGVSGVVEVQCYVLPHKDRLDSGQHEAYAGPHGWTAQQGFYVYRNERLLVSGSWLGLGKSRAWTKEEAHRLARIRVDIPNTADTEWKIDIRKSSARPPLSVRAALVRLAEDTRERARRVFAHRGQAVRISGKQLIRAWRTEHFNGEVRYRIDREHPAVKSVLDDAGPLGSRLTAMLRVIEETLPVQRIWLDTTEATETPRTGFVGEPASEVVSILASVYRNLVKKKGLSPTLAREQLLHTEPFHNYPQLVAALSDEPVFQE